MNMHRLWEALSSRVAAVAILMLSWSRFGFCSQIHDAARDGDLAKVKLLLKGNPNLVFSRDEDGMMPLHWAALMGHKDAAEILVANKADVNAKDNDGKTPLRIAESRDRQDMVNLLRQYGKPVVPAVGQNQGSDRVRPPSPVPSELRDLLNSVIVRYAESATRFGVPLWGVV